MSVSRRAFLKSAGMTALAAMAGPTTLGQGLAGQVAVQPRKTTASSRGKPNFLFIMTDQQTLRSLSCYKGTASRTPTIDRMASEGVRFETAYCAYPACMPSRAAFMTGRWPHVNGVRYNGTRLPRDEISMPKLFKEAGYRTALCGKDHCFGWKDVLAELFDHNLDAMHFGIRDPIPDDFPAGAKEANAYYREVLRPRVSNTLGYGVLPFAPELCDAGLITESCTRFIRKCHADNKPFFTWLSYPGPHWPFACPESYVDTVPPDKVDMPPHDDLSDNPENVQAVHRLLGMDMVTEADIRKVTSIYYGSVRYLDDQIQRVFQLLRELGIEEDTVVVFTSDHGEYMGEHGLLHKSNAAYDCLTRVPSVWWWPGHIQAGTTCNEFIEGIDLVPTVLDLCGLGIPFGVQGISHADGLLGKDAFTAREACFCESGCEGMPYVIDEGFVPAKNLSEAWKQVGSLRMDYWANRMKMVRTRRWKLAYYANGEGELYDMKNDPWELTNLYHSPDHREVVEEHKHRLLNWTIETEDTLPVLPNDRGKQFKNS